MFGSIVKGFADCLRAAESTRKYNVSIVADANSASDGIVNTTLPAVAVHIANSETANVYIGGMIEDRCSVVLSVMIDFDNPTLSKDNNFQVNMMNLAYELRNHIELSKRGAYFQDLNLGYSFFPLYKGFRTYITQAETKEAAKSITVYELRYECRLVANPLYAAANKTAELERIEYIDETDNTGVRKTVYIPPLLFVTVDKKYFNTKGNKRLTVKQ